MGFVEELPAAKGAWSWYDKRKNIAVPVTAPADGRARLADGAPRAIEGWLKFVPAPPQKKE
jgi:hypothetical protein